MTTTDTKSAACDEDTFIERFRPIINHIDSNAGFDFGYGGCLFETYGVRVCPLAERRQRMDAH